MTTMYDKYPFPDNVMIGLAIRALKGDKRHQYTMECLKERDLSAYERIMDIARREAGVER